MIKIDRGPEPATLPPIRDAEIARVAAIAAAGQPTSKQIGARYAVAHEALWQAQHFKCCYCEAKEQSKRNDVEHFRPKARAVRTPGSHETHGYWWLAWTWENLMFSCRNCNQSPAKLDKFPLDHGSVALVPHQPPPGNEQPLLVDPSVESGRPHIRFVPESTTGQERWQPVPRNGSQKGQQTIRVCCLDRPDLLDRYTEHVNLEVRPRCDRVRAAIAAGDSQLASREWERMTAALLNPRQCFVALAYDAIEHLVPREDREAYGLVLPEI